MKKYGLNNSVFFKINIILLFAIYANIEIVSAQNYSFSPPIRLNENVNSQSEESMPIISPNGDKLYFVRTFNPENTGGKLSGQDIWLSVKNEFGEWGPAINTLTNLNNVRNNAVIGMNNDETSLFLLNSYRTNTTRIHGIAKSILNGNEWGKPSDIKINGLESDNSFIGFHMNKSEDVLLISMNASNSLGEEDLYVSLLDENGKWSSPENIGATVNTKGFEISPYLSNDSKTLFFSSDGHNGYGGADIFMSRRLYDSWIIWSKPINLGKDINSDGFEAYLSLHNEEEAYFVSTRDGDFADIYHVDVTAVDDRKEVAEINSEKYKLTETEIQELLGLPVNRSIYFDFESFEVAASSRELIYFLANKLVTSFQYSIELVGHTSQEGTDEFNQELSINRANEVARHFQEFGITPNRISTSGVGETQPIIEEGTEEELAKNRRVEIYFVK